MALEEADEAVPGRHTSRISTFSGHISPAKALIAVLVEAVEELDLM